MSGPRGWFSMRMSVRVGRQHWLLQVRPERRQWLIAMAFVLMLVGYVVGAVPTFMVLRTSGLNSNLLEIGRASCRERV